MDWRVLRERSSVLSKKVGCWLTVIVCGLAIANSIALIQRCSVESVQNANFYPMDGDYQNYNVVRHLRAGQSPFKDFHCYLGLGHLVVNRIGMWYGDTYRDHKEWTYIATAVTLFLISYMLTFLLTKKHCISILTATFVLALVYQFNGFIPKEIESFERFFGHYPFPGNSMRLVRALPVVLLPFAFFFTMRWRRKPIVEMTLISVLVGLSLPWSNDFGLATGFCMGLIYFLIMVSEAVRKERRWYHLVLFPMLCLAICFAVVTALTSGGFSEWFQYNFHGVAAYQYWYYDRCPKTMSIKEVYWEVAKFFPVLVGIFTLSEAYDVATGKKTKRDAALLIVLAGTCLCFMLMLYGAASARPFMFKMIIALLIISRLLELCFRNILVKAFIALLLVGFFLDLRKANAATMAANATLTPRNEVEQCLGGRLLGSESVMDAADKVKDATFFSTYSTAINEVLGLINPGKDDYIIHALGDQPREEYLQTFLDFSPEYVEISNVNHWSVWSRRANWFFFRHVFRHYSVWGETDYSIILKKNDDGQTNELMIAEKDMPTVEIVDSDNGDVVIRVSAPSLKDLPFIAVADVRVTYDAFLEGMTLFNGYVRCRLTATDYFSDKKFRSQLTIAGYGLPASAKDWTLPVFLEDGVGEVRLSLSADQANRIDIASVKMDGVVPYLPRLHTGQGTWLADEIVSAGPLTVQPCEFTNDKWINGVFRESGGFRVEYSWMTRNALEQAEAVKLPSGEIRHITNLKRGPQYIDVFLGGPALDGKSEGYPCVITVQP